MAQVLQCYNETDIAQVSDSYMHLKHTLCNPVHTNSVLGRLFKTFFLRVLMYAAQ